MAGRNLVPAGASWADVRSGFHWPVHERFNIAEATVGHWSKYAPGSPALIVPRETGGSRIYTYADLDRFSRKLSVVFAQSGLEQGDRVAIYLPPTPEAVIVHLAAYRNGLIAVPLFALFRSEALKTRLNAAGAKLIVTDSLLIQNVAEIQDDLQTLQQAFTIDGASGARDFWAALAAARGNAPVVDTKPDTPALLMFTSGTTGPPKGVLHGHRMLLGHLPGVETHHDMLPQPGDCLWTPADWAWIGGLANVLLAGLYHGVPVVAHRMPRFDPEAAYDLMSRHQVRNVFLPPTALKLMRGAALPPASLSLRSVAAGGEPLGSDLLDWGRSAFGLQINEFYGATECNLVLGNSATLFKPRPGSMGRAIPGKDVAVIDAEGKELPPDTPGEIAVRRGDPAMFLGYWNDEAATKAKFAGDWMRMGDEGQSDEDGYFRFSARTDDVITSAGYRIGPSEIEECLARHPGVAMAAAIGEPHPIKGHVVRAFVVLADGANWDGLEDQLIRRVEVEISPHVAPKRIIPVGALPMTMTGKILRRELRDF